ncbi:hypothetical protein LZ32DRAFT_358393 [Colletotrichum eremochloae]|nr:hypothetical protein LZ32DRAFT_358393 [Colletotrichum eremochloae]
MNFSLLLHSLSTQLRAAQTKQGVYLPGNHGGWLFHSPGCPLNYNLTLSPGSLPLQRPGSRNLPDLLVNAGGRQSGPGPEHPLAKDHLPREQSPREFCICYRSFRRYSRDL